MEEDIMKVKFNTKKPNNKFDYGDLVEYRVNESLVCVGIVVEVPNSIDSDYAISHDKGTTYCVEDSELTLVVKKGFINRKYNPLPNKDCIIQVIQNDTIFLCSYQPNIDKSIPNLIGSATVIEGKHKEIGFNVWENNDSEFIYYKIIQ